MHGISRNGKVREILAHPDRREPLDAAIRRTLSRALRACSKSRESVAEELSILLGMPVSARSLNNYTAESKSNYRFPAAWVVAFCKATGDDSLQRLLLGPELAAILQLGETAKEAILRSKLGLGTQMRRKGAQ
jgi:hypothetical protein